MKKTVSVVGLAVLLATYVGFYGQLRRSGQLFRTHTVLPGSTEGSYRNFEVHLAHNKRSQLALVGSVVCWPVFRAEKLLCEQTDWIVSDKEKAQDARIVADMLRRMQSSQTHSADGESER